MFRHTVNRAEALGEFPDKSLQEIVLPHTKNPLHNPADTRGLLLWIAGCFVRSFFLAGIVALFAGGTQVGSDPGRDGVGRGERVAPDAENPPALTAKQPGDAMIAGAVAGDFVPPVFAVSPGHAAMPWAAVPEAAVNEDGQALTSENEVGTAGERLVPPPAGDAGGAQNGHQFQLSFFVSTGVDGGHDL